MTCAHCVQTVKKALESLEGIQAVEVTLDPPQVRLTLSRHRSIEELNAALQEVAQGKNEKGVTRITCRKQDEKNHHFSMIFVMVPPGLM